MSKLKIDVGVFNAIVIVLTFCLLLYMFMGGFLSIEGLTSNIGGSLLKVALFIFIVYGIEFFERGIGRNIRDEIYEQNNVAAGLFQGLLRIGIAIVIAGGIL